MSKSKKDVTADSKASLGSVEESLNEEHENESQEEEKIVFKDPRLVDEARKSKTRPLSASSTESVCRDDD